MTRRKFMVTASAFAAACGRPGLSAGAGRPNIRFGVLSDLHITDWASTETFRRALRYYRTADVDAVMVCGDLSDLGVLCNLKNVAKAWNEVFPDDKGASGRRVEKLFIFGNHDVEPGEYGLGNVGLARILMECPGYRTDEVRRQRLDLIGVAKAWEACFHEPYEPIYRKRIRGYDFIGAHWDTQARVRGLEDWFAKNAQTLDPSKPFFYFQHPHPKGTVNSDGPFSHDDGTTTRILSSYPNAVVFSGHSHTTLTDERTLWRGAFTSIGASTLTKKGAKPNLLLENFYTAPDPVFPARQGLLVSVYDDRLVIDRRDFFWGERIDEPWRLPLPARAEERAARMTNAPSPQFADTARVHILFPKKIGGEGVVRFPPALAEPSARPYDYTVSVDYRFGEDVLASHTFRAYGPTALFPKAHDGDISRVALTVPAGCLPRFDLGEVRVTVIPRNSLGSAGKPISSGWVTVPKM